MKEEPKPGTWMLITTLFAAVTVALSGSWWQVVPLTLLAVSGGTWAEHNTLWNNSKAERSRSGGYQPRPTQFRPVPPKGGTGVH